MILDRLDISRTTFENGTGQVLRPEGACQGETCVPLPGQGDTVDVAAVAERLGMPLVHDAAAGPWALGPAAPGGQVRTSAQAPGLRLPDLDGVEFALSSLRGRKVMLVAWAPY